TNGSRRRGQLDGNTDRLYVASQRTPPSGGGKANGHRRGDHRCSHPCTVNRRACGLRCWPPLSCGVSSGAAPTCPESSTAVWTQSEGGSVGTARPTEGR